MNNKHLYQQSDDILIVKKQITTEPKVLVKQTPVFTLNKSTTQSWSLDKTILAPNKLTMLSGASFKQAYEKQLNALLYNQLEQLDADALMLITSLSDIVEQTHRSIRLVIQGFHKKSPVICTTLNEFYRNNHDVIRGISQQLAN